MELGGLYKTIVDKKIPFFVTVEVTTRCNNRCVHCYNSKPCDLPVDLYKKGVAEAAELGALFLSITGGEPLLRGDIWDILEYAVEKNFATLLYTNATLIGRPEALRLKELGIYHVDTTILGANAETHDSLTGVVGSFDKTLEAIRILKENSVNVAVKTPILKENAPEIEEIRRMMDSFGIDLIASPLIFPKDDGGASPLCHRPDNGQLKDFFASCEVKDLAERKGAYSCHLGSCTFAVRSNGEVTPCICVPMRAGHVSEAPLADIWKNSKELIEIRNRSDKPLPECEDCELKGWCFRCEGLSLTESGKLFSCSKELSRMAEIRKEVSNARTKE